MNIEDELRAVLSPAQAPILDTATITPTPAKNPVSKAPAVTGGVLTVIAAAIAVWWDSLPDWFTSLFTGG